MRRTWPLRCIHRMLSLKIICAVFDVQAHQRLCVATPMAPRGMHQGVALANEVRSRGSAFNGYRCFTNQDSSAV
jgi:hypothetical protein